MESDHTFKPFLYMSPGVRIFLAEKPLKGKDFVLGTNQKNGRMGGCMESEAEVNCPYCGQRCTLVVDTSVARQQFTTDCEVCCRPFQVSVECEPGEILAVDVQSE
jgi:hypothetical protein